MSKKIQLQILKNLSLKFYQTKWLLEIDPN